MTDYADTTAFGIAEKRYELPLGEVYDPQPLQTSTLSKIICVLVMCLPLIGLSLEFYFLLPSSWNQDEYGKYNRKHSRAGHFDNWETWELIQIIPELIPGYTLYFMPHFGSQSLAR